MNDLTSRRRCCRNRNLIHLRGPKPGRAGDPSARSALRAGGAAPESTTTGLSPITPASWPGPIRYMLPGVNAPVEPSSCSTGRLPPETASPTCSTWHESMPTSGMVAWRRRVDRRPPALADRGESTMAAPTPSTASEGGGRGASSRSIIGGVSAARPVDRTGSEAVRSRRAERGKASRVGTATASPPHQRLPGPGT
jgi:hypothetical protein